MERGNFKPASLAVWEAMAAGWDARHAYFEEVAQPVTRLMIERLDPSPGETILDLAAGTGVVGLSISPLVGEAGRVVVSDFAEAMVAAAARRSEDLGLENVECRVLDAERLDLSDGSVDGVVCRWGYMLMPDPGGALRETRRVVGPEGRAVGAVFAGPERNQWAALPARVLQEHGHMPAAGPGTPGILALADPERLRDLFTDAGFGDTAIEEVGFELDFAGMADYWTFLTEVAGALAMVLEQLTEDDRTRVRNEIAGQLAVGDSEPFTMPATSLVASAT
jgi:ubiquinone/menaquinone biosynthesis C-methylase UbiE